MSPHALITEASASIPMVWFDITLTTGAADDPVGQEGLIRHAAVLARRGAGTRNRYQIDVALDDLGSPIEVAVGRDTISFSGNCLARHFENVLAIVASLLHEPRFDEEEHLRLLRETPQILDEIRDDDAALVVRWFDRCCAPGHPYGRALFGTNETIAGFSLGSARAAWSQLAYRENLLVGLAGDLHGISPAAVYEQLAAGLPSRPQDRLLPSLPDLPKAKRLVVVDREERTQSQLRFGHTGPRWGDPAAIALLIAETAFGGMFTSRLMQEIRVKRGWSYGAGCGLKRSRLPHWFEIWMATDIAVTDQAINLTHEMFEALADQGLSAQEFEFARDYLIGAMPFHTATARQRMQLAVRDAAFGLPPGTTAKIPSLLRELTLADVNAACRHSLHPEALLTVAVTTRADVEAALHSKAAQTVEVYRHDEY